ncbi:MAG: CPCC family cysteine-rich protein [Armatimonadota bacterium]|nr:hypothetical protein [bacterium]
MRLGQIGVTPGTTCPVCGLEDAFDEPGGYDICERCGWEDDPVQSANPDPSGGANKESLNEARKHSEEMIARWQRVRRAHGN